MERLSLPRRNYQAIETDNSPQTCRPELPKDPLPTWVTLPMDSKLPMLSGPKKSVLLYTTNLGEKMHMSSPELDFDLSDPYALTMSNNYKPLHDPHLKPHLVTPHMRKRLFQGGFITRDGKVVCTLKEYNEYRQYLRKINLLLDKKGLQEIESQKKKAVGRDGDKRSKGREDKVKSIRERLEKQYQEEKERYIRLIAEDEERRQKLREVQLSRMSERERQLREEHERRQALVEQKQEEDRKKKMEMLRTWMKEDKERCELSEKRKALKSREQQKRLAQSWEERRKLQYQRLEQERRIRSEAELIKQRRLKERERMVNRQRRRQQAIFERMTRRQREEREKLEAEYAKNIAARLERRKKRAHRRKAMGKKKGKDKTKPEWKSNWDTTQLLLKEFSDSDAQPRSASAAVEPMVDKVGSRRAISDIQFPVDSLSMEPEETKEMVTSAGIPTPARITKGLNELVKKEMEMDEPDASDLASALIFTNNYLAKEVIYPALSRVTECSKQKKSIRFSMAVEEMPFEAFDYEYDVEYDEVHDEGDESDDEYDDDRSGSTLLAAVDSLTKIRRDSSVDHSPLAGLADILCRILEKLERGELSQDKAAKLSAVARDILLESFVGDGVGSPSSDLSQTSLSQQSSSTSLVAAEVVKITMDKVQQELFKHFAENELGDFYEWPLVKNTSSELTGMSKFVAETAIAMAVESLMSCTDDIIERQRGSASDSQLFSRGIKGKGTGTASDSRLGATKSESTESVSCTSEFIINILNKIVEQVKEEQKLYTPVKPSVKKSEPSSVTSLYIMDTLQRVVAEVQAELAEQSPDLLLNQPKSKTSVFVMDTLDRVVKEIQRSRSPSATSLYIDTLLCNISNDISTDESNMSWDKSYDIHSKREKTSVTSLFIRNTLSKVLHEIDDDFRRQSDVSPSITSLFADEIVKATLKKCASAVCQEMLPGPKLTELTAAIISSQQRNEMNKSSPDLANNELEFPTKDPDVSHSFGGVSDNQRIASVNLAESLIKTTLEKARESLSSGTICAQQVVQVLSRMNASSGSFTAIGCDGKAVPAAVCSSELANEFVITTIENTLHEIEKDLNERTGDLSWDSMLSGHVKESEIASLVKSILEKAVKELNEGLADESTIEKMEIDIRQSLEDTNDANHGTIQTPEKDSSACCNEEGCSCDDKDGVTDEINGDQGDKTDGGNLEDKDISTPDVLYEEDDDFDEVLIQPIYHGETLALDPKIVGKALMAISVKHLDEMEDLTDPLPRNSFRNLICPDVSELSGVDSTSKTSIKSDLVRASVGALPSQTRLRIKAASVLSQGCKKSSSTAPVPTKDPEETTTKGSPKGSPTLNKTKSLQDTVQAPKQKGSRTSPFSSPTASPSSSPKQSKTKLTRASLTGASAPTLMTATRKRSPTKLSSTNMKDVSPSTSRRTVASTSGSDTKTNAVNRSPSGGSSKSTDARSPSSGSVGKRLSASKVKMVKSERKKSGEPVVKKGSSKTMVETDTSVEKIDADVKTEEGGEPKTEEPVAVSETTESEQQIEAPDENQVEKDPETPPEEIEVSKRTSYTKKDQPLPRESGPIEMVSSANPPSIKKSSETETGLKSNSSDITSPPNSHRSLNLAPRPSSGFKKSSSSLGKSKRSSDESVGGKDTRRGSTQSLPSVKGSSSADEQAKEVSSDIKIEQEKS